MDKLLCVGFGKVSRGSVRLARNFGIMKKLFVYEIFLLPLFIICSYFNSGLDIFKLVQTLCSAMNQRSFNTLSLTW